MTMITGMTRNVRMMMSGAISITGLDEGECFRDETHRAILRLQGLDALGHVAIVDIAAVNLHEVF
jgi:hypothetical protein